VMMAVLILHVKIPPGLQIQQLLTMLHPGVKGITSSRLKIKMVLLRKWLA
jgi:hypothetical protein